MSRYNNIPHVWYKSDKLWYNQINIWYNQLLKLEQNGSDYGVIE